MKIFLKDVICVGSMLKNTYICPTEVQASTSGGVDICGEWRQHRDSRMLSFMNSL